MAHEAVHKLFSRRAAEFPDETAIQRAEQSITYRELEEQSDRLARALSSVGAGRGSFVAILSENPIEVITAILGTLKLGGVFCPLDPTFPRKRLATMVETVSPGWFVTGKESLGVLTLLTDAQPSAAQVIVLGDRPAGKNDERVLFLNDERFGDGGAPAHATSLPSDSPHSDSLPSDLLPDDSHPDDPCSIFFTSGSTGRPKPILGRLCAIDHFARWEAHTLGVTQGTRVSQLASPAFDGFLKDAFVPLCSGGTACAPDSRQLVLDPGRLIDWIDVESVEVLHCVPSVFRAMLNEGLKADYFASLRWVVLAGEPLLPEDVRRWRAVFGQRVRLMNLYGPTETAVTKLFHEVGEGDEARPSVPIGRPMPGAEVLLLNSKGEQCRPGVVGEIYIRTRYRALGYYKEPELTAEAFVVNPESGDAEDVVYRTGDFGRVGRDGVYEFLGRRDQQVKVRGVRVELGEVENLLLGQGGVRDVAVVDREGADGTKFLCAYLVLSDGAETGQIRAYLSEQLPEFMLPSAFVVMDELPRTLNGKVDRKALPTVEEARAQRQDGEAPSTPVEEIVAGIWCEVLRLPRVSTSESFFELGGHSLLATQIISRLQQALGVELPLRALFESPTVAQLAARVEVELRSGKPADAEPIRPADRDGGELPLSYAQQRMWFLHQLSPSSSAFNMPLGVRLRGALSVAALEQSFAEIERRHEVLRTTFPEHEGHPLQMISPPSARALACVDLSRLSEAEREAETARLASEDARRPFDLARGPLLRVYLVRLSADEHVVASTMHHLVGDAWSFEVLTKELSRLYDSYAGGEPSPLRELPLQHADYAAWQRRWLSGQRLEERLDFWGRQLEGAPQGLRLPRSRPRPATPSFSGARRPVVLPEELAARVRELGRREGATLFMTLLAGFSVLLWRYTGEEDLVVGSVIANRERAEVQGLIGFLANTLVLRVDVSGGPNYAEVIRRVRETCLAAYEQQVPPEVLMDGLPGVRQPLFEVWFQVERAAREQLKLGGVEWEPFEVERGDARFELSFVLAEAGEEVRGEVEYDAELYDEETIEQMLAHFNKILEEMVARPDSSIADLSLVSAQEAEQLSWGFSVDL